MKKRIVILTIFLLISGLTSYGQVEADMRTLSLKPGSSESSFTSLLEQNALSLDFVSGSQGIKQETALNLIWSGGGLLEGANTKGETVDSDAELVDDLDTTKSKANEVFTHPTYFTSLLDFYYLTDSALYKYDYKNNSLNELKKGNHINSLNLASDVRSCILIGLSQNFDRLSEGIEIKLSNNKKYKNMLKEVKSFHRGQKSLIKEVSYIEAGAAVSNIMLMASSQGLSYHPLSVMSRSKSISKKLGIKSGESRPFIVIPLAKAESGDNKNQKAFVQGLIQGAKNAKSGDFKKKGTVSPDLIRQLMWAANGIVSNGGAKVHPSGLPVSCIEVYYINQKQVQQYEMASNSLKTIQFRDLRFRLGKTYRKFKAKDYLIISIKSSQNGSGLFSGKAGDMISKNKEAFQNKKYQKALSLYQTGVALQNIRLLATDLGLSYQLNHVQAGDRKDIASGLSLSKGDLPVMIIPLAPK